jgi:hypothetical protein
MFASWLSTWTKARRQRHRIAEPLRTRARLTAEHLEDRLLMAATLDLTGVEWRMIDGTRNNLVFGSPLFKKGAAGTQQIRFGYLAEFPDAIGDEIITSRPNPRSISNAIHAQSTSVPSVRLLTDWVFQWGQFLTHDMDLTRTGGEFLPIPVLDSGDPFGQGTLIPFFRSQFDAATGKPGVVGKPPPFQQGPNSREVINSVTSYIDGSVIYGSDEVRAAALRTGQGGKLKTSANGQLLAHWDPTVPGILNDDPFHIGPQLFLSGDVRANENVGLTAVHTLFVLEHNRLATRIVDLYPDLNDEQVYQVARRLVGAEIQAITYEEFLPAVFGYDLAPRPDGPDAVYNPAVDASITNAFAHALFRGLGHSQISEAILLVNNGGNAVGSLSIDDAFFNPNFLADDPKNLGRVLLGLASQVQQETDLLITDGIRNNLFGPPGAGGLDLAAIDIQRGRDHGLPNYNSMRSFYGLSPVTSFSQISSKSEIQDTLEALYGNVNNIDLFVGALAEDHLPGTDVGPLMNAVVGNQFIRLRDGDRFFYTNEFHTNDDDDDFLQLDAVKRILDINDVTLANIIRWNTNINNIQDNVFFDPSVLVFKVPDGGANISLTASNNSLTLSDTQTGKRLARESLHKISQVILVGSNTAADVFNLYLASANGRLENGVVVYGGSSAGDRLNVYGRPQNDTFTVANTSFSTSLKGPSLLPPETMDQRVTGRKVLVNGNTIESTGFETTRLVRMGGNDTPAAFPPGLASMVDFWDPLDER